MNIQGLPAIYLNPGEKLLHKGLRGGWHYKTDNSGKAISNVPEKDEISHICEAWANGVCVMLPVNVAQNLGEPEGVGSSKPRKEPKPTRLEAINGTPGNPWVITAGGRCWPTGANTWTAP